ncbi:MAG: hypothetical protein M3Q73_00210 [bacterium]|nr:hypothetical protein [bacterium]
MIRVRISGGLGNQMFQYALARAIKEKTGLDVVLDTHFYTNIAGQEAKRSFDLWAFNISLPQTNRSDTSIIEKLTRATLKVVDAGKPLNKRKRIIEPSFTYQKEMTNHVRDNSYISGIWQS